MQKKRAKIKVLRTLYNKGTLDAFGNALAGAYEAYQFAGAVKRGAQKMMFIPQRAGAKRQRVPYVFGGGGGGGGGGRAAPYVPRAPRYIPGYRRRGMVSPSTIYRFTRCTTDGTFGEVLNPTFPAVNMQYGFAIKLNDLPNSAEFVAMYDQFKITYVSWHFLCANSAAETQINDAHTATQAAVNGWCHTVIDRTDVTAESVDALRQHSTYKVCRLTDLDGKKMTRGYVPKINMTVAGTAQAQSPSKMWLDTATSAGVEHFGMKAAFTFPTGLISTSIPIEIYAKVHVSFRNAK